MRVNFFLKYLYHFDNNGKFLKKINIEDISYIYSKISNYEMIYFKSNNSENFYSIIVFDFPSGKWNINYFYYKINLNGDNILIYNNTYSNNEEQITYTSGFTCQKTISNINKKYITCFYQYSKNSIYVIGEITFDPDNNFTFIEDRKYIELFATNYNFQNGVSTTNSDKSKVYVCYTSYSLNASCFYFDINSREFSSTYTFGKDCRSIFLSLNINYLLKLMNLLFHALMIREMVIL